MKFLMPELRPSAESLTELQRSEGRESCEEQTDTSIHSPEGGDLAKAVSKMVARMVRHYDERQSDGSMHCDTTGPVLLKLFAKHGARYFSERYWLYLSS